MLTLKLKSGNSAGFRFLAVFLGSACFLLLKTLLVAAIEGLWGLPAWCAYLAATLAVLGLGWLYHSKVSFQLPLSWFTLRRYFAQAAAMTFLDYVLYSGLVYICGVHLVLSVLLTGGLVFSMRLFLLFRYVFVKPRHHLDEAMLCRKSSFPLKHTH